jgi:hypothetical protein
MAETPLKPASGLPLPIRRVIACIAIFVFLILYVMGVLTIGDFIKENKGLSLAFYSLAGLLWGLPILPIISWSEAYKRKR